MNTFQLLCPKKLDFGPGAIARLAQHILPQGREIALIRGGASLEKSGSLGRICTLLREHDISWHDFVISGEPAPADVDEIVAALRGRTLACVVAVGGGSVLDAGKAVAAMLGMPGSVRDYLEKVGHKIPQARRVGLIAVPTTSGTGSEATKNAVLSEVGACGFKSSLRHDSYIPDVALLDPELMLACPVAVTAASGMDALAQLLESYLSTKANPITDALAESGLKHFGRSFPEVCSSKAADVCARGDIAYAAYLSGLTLANAGLGTVHGIAGVVGGYYPVPHGRACAALLAPVMKMTLAKLAADHPAVVRMAQAAGLLTGNAYPDPQAGARVLISYLENLSQETAQDSLSGYGLNAAGMERISLAADNKNNPVQLDPAEIRTLLQALG